MSRVDSALSTGFVHRVVVGGGSGVGGGCGTIEIMFCSRGSRSLFTGGLGRLLRVAIRLGKGCCIFFRGR